MLSIYVCDDIPEQSKYICSIINKYLVMQDWDINSAIYTTSPYELLECISKDSNTGLYFLDVNLKSDMDGFDTAKKIREKDPRGFIVFITTHDEMASLAFRHHVEAMDYIIKNKLTIKQAIRNCIDEAYKLYQNFATGDDNRICLKVNRKNIYLEKQNILAITTSTIPHQLVISTVSSEFTLYGHLNEFERQIVPEFIRIHKACLINPLHIIEVDRKNLTIKMSNGFTYKASNRFIKNV